MTTGGEHTPSAIGKAIQNAVRLSGTSQNNVLAWNRDAERSIVLDPLSRGAQATEVDEVFTKKSAPPRREENAVRLRDVALRANDILRNCVLDQAAHHLAARDELEDEVVRPPPVDRFSLEIEQRILRPSQSEDLSHHRDVLFGSIAKVFGVVPDRSGEDEPDRQVYRDADVEPVNRGHDENREDRENDQEVARRNQNP